MSVGSNIRQIRESRGLSQVQLSTQAGISQAMLCQVERGTKVPSLLLSAELAKVLQCNINDFLENSA